MGVLLDCQCDIREPVAFTHFDCWLEEDGDPHTYSLEHYSTDALLDVAKGVFEAWKEELSLPHTFASSTSNAGAVLMAAVGPERFMELLCMDILSFGYDVYIGSTFIEIYRPFESHDLTDDNILAQNTYLIACPDSAVPRLAEFLSSQSGGPDDTYYWRHRKGDIITSIDTIVEYGIDDEFANYCETYNVAEYDPECGGHIYSDYRAVELLLKGE